MTAQADLTLGDILERLGLAGAPLAEQRRKVGELAYAGRLPLPWLRVLRQENFLPYDHNRPHD